jgi:hypothetical protein
MTHSLRSQPAVPTNVTASRDAGLPSSQIDLSWTNAAGTDETGFAVYRSTDGVNFTLLGTLDASTTRYSDGGLAAGRTYFYYVLSLLNSGGASAPSAAVSSATSMEFRWPTFRAENAFLARAPPHAGQRGRRSPHIPCGSSI